MSNTTKAIKAIYPEIKSGFVYWESKSDGSSWEKPIDGLAWENTEFTKPTWEQIETALLVVNLQEAKDKKRAEIKALRDSNLQKPTPQTINYSGALSNRTFDIDVVRTLPLINSFLSTLKEKRQIWIDDADFAQYNRARFGIENPTRGFTDANGERLELGIDDFRSLKFHLDDRDEVQFNQYQARVNFLETLTTIEEIEAYDINTVYA
jgi:hypothetical protein